ncbi:unnamed protein product [Adineta ricciae]|uniref:Uncharacterized protein n=1 Tax=Adineta ricciae TaxID=249248 RepID=A0A814JKQ6_ADIRI|nr:unnamed protein product [Adineta ricciae]CAF1038808.1 unnamed protein product [Adineta ricciae]
MNERRSCPHHQQKFEDKFRILEDELKRKGEPSNALRNEIIPSTSTMEQSVSHNPSQRSTMITNSNWITLTKDREIAKLKALIFQKDNELIELTTLNKNALIQMEARMERERKIWNEHKELFLAGERAKFEEEKTRFLKDAQDQLKLEQERCQRLEQKLYTVQMQSSEAQLMLKESAREHINSVYNMKEQCRKEFLDEISRLRNQFQLDREKEYTRLQERIHELETTVDQLSKENMEISTRSRELMLTLEVSEKTCVRSLYDCIKKLLMVMESPSQTYTSIPTVTSFTYDRESLIERLPTRNVLKFLQNKIDDVRKYLDEQKESEKPKLLIDRADDNIKSVQYQKSDELSNDAYCLSIARTCPIAEDHHSSHPFQFSQQQSDTIDNLVQKLENHIACELDRLTKQRLAVSSSNDRKNSMKSHPSKLPKKIKSDPICLDTTGEFQYDESLYQPSKLSSHLEIPNHHFCSSMYLDKNPITD